MDNTNLSPVLECSQAPVIRENLMDLAAEFQARKDYIDSLPRTEENLKAVKEIRAACNKQVEQLEQQRKAVKAAVMAPYNAAERIYKGFITEPHKRLDEACKAFTDQVEGDMKQSCQQRLEDYFRELKAMKGIPWLKWERLGIRVDMATARLKEPTRAMDRIKAFVDRVCADLDTLAQMEGSAQLLAEYETCLDVAEAIRRVEARRQAERIAQENHRTREARQTQAAQLTGEAAKAAEAGTLAMPRQETKFRVTFTVTATMPMLRGLKAFLEDKKYEYQEAQEDD